MCGIVGFLDKTQNSNAPVGKTILAMLTALGVRGPDSAGVALYGPPENGAFTLQVKLGELEVQLNGVLQLQRGSRHSAPCTK